jgi:hypothetical protein
VDIFRSASRLRWWPVACTGDVGDRVDDADVGVDADVGEVCCRGVFFPRGALCGGGEGMRSTGAISRWRGVACALRSSTATRTRDVYHPGP